MAYHVGLATHKILILAPVADNLHPPSAPATALSDHAVVSFEGPDALAFAHAQFANDVLALAVGQWQWNAWLTPKGRVIALFALLRRDEQTLWAVLPDYAASDLVAQLQRFVFRRKLKIQTREDLAVFGLWQPPRAASGLHWAQDQDAVELDRGHARQPRCWRIAPAAQGAAQAEDGERAWAAADLRQGLPRLPASQREQWTPQQLSLDRWQAYSVKKGCYPGQEIVARTHFLGKAKRGLRLFALPAAEAGQRVFQDDRDVGEVICAASDADTTWALAVLPLDDAATMYRIADAAVEARAFDPT